MASPQLRKDYAARTFSFPLSALTVMRSDAMLEKSDLDGQAVWKRVLKAVEEIQRQERREDEVSHYPCTRVNTSCAGMSPLSARAARLHSA